MHLRWNGNARLSNQIFHTIEWRRSRKKRTVTMKEGKNTIKIDFMFLFNWKSSSQSMWFFSISLMCDFRFVEQLFFSRVELANESNSVILTQSHTLSWLIAANHLHIIFTFEKKKINVRWMSKKNERIQKKTLQNFNDIISFCRRLYPLCIKPKEEKKKKTYWNSQFCLCFATFAVAKNAFYFNDCRSWRKLNEL